MILQQLVNGLMLGSSYALIGVAFSLILGVLDVLNIAIGEVFMLGAFFSLTLVRQGVPFIPALLIAMVLSMLAGPILGIAEVLSVAYLGAAHRDVVVLEAYLGRET